MTSCCYRHDAMTVDEFREAREDVVQGVALQLVLEPIDRLTDSIFFLKRKWSHQWGSSNSDSRYAIWRLLDDVLVRVAALERNSYPIARNLLAASLTKGQHP